MSGAVWEINGDIEDATAHQEFLAIDPPVAVGIEIVVEIHIRREAFAYRPELIIGGRVGHVRAGGHGTDERIARQISDCGSEKGGVCGRVG